MYRCYTSTAYWIIDQTGGQDVQFQGAVMAYMYMYLHARQQTYFSLVHQTLVNKGVICMYKRYGNKYYFVSSKSNWFQKCCILYMTYNYRYIS